MRLLRVMLMEVETPLSATTAAELSGLTVMGAQKALNRLADTGVVVSNGQGRSRQYALQSGQSILKPLRNLFDHEIERYERIVNSIKKTLSELREVRSAWIDNLPMGSRGMIELNVVVDVKSVGWIATELRSRFSEIESLHDVVIEFSINTRADGKEPGLDAIILVLEPKKPDKHAGMAIKSHHEAEDRSLLFSRGVVELMKNDPSLIVRAKRHLSLLLREDQGMATEDLMEWKQLLETYNPSRLSDLLVATNSRAVRLRQSSPFFAVLTDEERNQIFEFMEKNK